MICAFIHAKNDRPPAAACQRILARKEGFELPGRGFILYFYISKSSNKFAFLQLSLHYVAKGFNQFYRDKGQNKGRE